MASGRGIVALAVALSLAAAACGSGDDTRGTDGATTSPTSTTSGEVSTTTVLPSETAAEPAEACRGTGAIENADLAYDSVEGVDSNLLSLDLYEPVRPKGCDPAPIMMYVHGGGWRGGDKANKIDNKVEWFTGEGWVFVSVNYRLSPASVPADPADLDPSRIAYPTHNQDVASAVSWVRENAAEYGGDPEAVTLMGHSAGGAITAAVATDESYLEAHGLGLSALRCAVVLDSAVFDVRWRIDNGANPGLYLNAFGPDPDVWDEASPVNHVEPGKDLPAFFLVVRGLRGRPALAAGFADKLRAAGTDADVLIGEGLDHEGVNSAVGDPDDTVVTPPLADFLEGCR